MDRWRGRVALVTGASSGIGASLCAHLAKHGIRVVGCARNVDRIRALASEDDIAPGTIHAIKCDLEEESQILAMFEEIRRTFGRIDICVNNAGLAIKGDLLDGNTADWKTVLNVNVMALCICTREAVKLMQENNIDDGQIIHISSMAAHRSPPWPTIHFYSGTKFMVRALGDGLRSELKALNSHIRVASISPGLVETEFVYRMQKDSPDAAKHLYSAIQCLQASDIASAVLYVLQTPPHVDIIDIKVLPTEQTF